MSFLRIALPDLPKVIGSLVNDGIYALYAVDGREFPYLLMTDTGVLYSVSEDGAVGDKDLAGASIKDFNVWMFVLIEGL